MSQVALKQDGSAPPPFIVNSYEVDYAVAPPTTPGEVVPDVSGVVTVHGGSGIDVFTPVEGSNDMVVKIKNSVTDTSQTVGFQTINLSTIDCSVVGTYKFTSEISAYESTGPNGAGVTLYTTVKSDGVNVTVIGDSDPVTHIDDDLNQVGVGGAIDYEIIGSGTDAILTVTGTTGFTIDWAAFTVYVYRG